MKPAKNMVGLIGNTWMDSEDETFAALNPVSEEELFRLWHIELFKYTEDYLSIPSIEHKSKFFKKHGWSYSDYVKQLKF